jgi:hypothetical protein
MSACRHHESREQCNRWCEPFAACPYCGEDCEADFVDVEVGMVQVSPYACACGAVQIGPHDEPRELTDEERRTGWYAPPQEPES